MQIKNLLMKSNYSKTLLFSFSALLTTWPYLHFLANNLKFFDFDWRSLVLLSPIPIFFGILLFLNLFSNRKIFITLFMIGGILFFMTYPLFSTILRQHIGPVQFYFPQFVLGMLTLWIISSFLFYKLPYQAILIFLGILNFSSAFNLYQELYGGRFSSYQEEIKKIKFKYKPNIYLLVSDSYPSLESLNLFTNYDNKPFYSWLTSKGFKTYPNAYSSYPRTTRSIATVLSMKNVENLISTRELNSIFNGDNIVNRYMNGYNIYYSFYCQDTKLVKCIAKNSEEYNFYSMIFNFSKLYLGNYLNAKIQDIFNLSSLSVEDYTHFEHLSKINLSQKTFIYSHTNHSNFGIKTMEASELMKSYNNDLSLSIKKILDYDSNAIIIAMADHGDSNDLRIKFKKPQNYEDIVKQTFGILMAVHWIKECKDYSQIKKITHANLFRYVFGCMQGKKFNEIELEEDVSYLRYSSTFKLIRYYPARKDGKILPNPNG